MELLPLIVSIFVAITVDCRGQLRHDIPDGPQQVKEAPSIIADGPQGRESLRQIKEAPSNITGRHEHHLQEHSVDIQQHKKACRNLNGKCVKKRKPCPGHLPQETSPGRPFCRRGKRCCYPETVTEVPTIIRAICNPECVGNRKCGAPNTCICLEGWQGDCCQEAICNPECVDNRTCVAPNTCICLEGWQGDYCQEDSCTALSPPGFWINFPSSCNDHDAFPTGIFRNRPLHECCQTSTSTCPNNNFTLNHVCDWCNNSENALQFTRDKRSPPGHLTTNHVFKDNPNNPIVYSNSAVNQGKIPFRKACLIRAITWICTTDNTNDWTRCFPENGKLCIAKSALDSGHLFPDQISCS